ncbi:5-formyltetrahydrofolate cyclo-ligase [Sphingopyxis indica]|uniref:5-formyltetrahydrofolate cyclo-ligase n=1 Tax=Sphingopyxis indica TaxID=436663 RepID=A0A239EKN7_9SPHN|nr:5-formyltetrahydrofolate cyclo-ligase [Sphingopyxis indica]SNS45330.1 5-formyltetrahydrofolate cyclo-ligase [Sphingopyxis indica]
MNDPSADLALQKQQLRERLRFRRKHFAANLDAMARLAAFRIVPQPLAERLTGRDPVAAYVAWGDEPDIVPMLAAYPLALPHHGDRSDAMSFCRWTPGEALAKGPWGTEQPCEPSGPVEPALIFCPLVGFDRQGNRLGQGGGHYDRYFADHPAIPRIGVGWSVQEVDALPAEPADMPLDAVLTEQEFIICGETL